MAVTKQFFGNCKCGRKITLYTIENAKGVKASVMNYGAILVKLMVPDKTGNSRDVVLGFDKLEDYYINTDFFGSTVGPNANRVCGASFSLEGKIFQLDANDGDNNLHSHREEGYHKRYWDAEVFENAVCFSLEDDNTLGFPGKKKIQVTYSLHESNRLQIDYRCTSDVKTVINPTNHSYFNLEGHQAGSIENHLVQIGASYYTPVVKGGIPTGEVTAVTGTPFDFTEEKFVGKEINAEHEQLHLTDGYDHNWVLDGWDGSMRRIATVTAPSSGIAMNVYTDLPGLQFYTGNFINHITGKGGCIYEKRQALCLETQYYPDTPNHPDFPQDIFGPDKEYHSTTIYEFLVQK